MAHGEDNDLLQVIEDNKDIISYLKDKKIITEDAFLRLQIYTYYKDCIKKGQKRIEAFYTVAQKFYKSERTIEKIIYQLNK